MGKLVMAISFALALGLPVAAAPLIPEGYREWEKTTSDLLNYPIPGHLDHYRIPYINSIGTGVTVETKGGRRTYTYPKGTIIVKEAYQGLEAPKPGDKPVLIYAMIKDPGNPKARGGWVWVLKDVVAGKEAVYQSPLCVDCHSAANESFPYGDKNPNSDFRDYVFFPYEK
jgi:hypothetical protein